MADDFPRDDIRAGPPGTPRWAKVFGFVALLVIVVFVILLVTGGPGAHGPRRHGADALGPLLGAPDHRVHQPRS